MRRAKQYVAALALVCIVLSLSWLFLSLEETKKGQSEEKPTERIGSPRKDSSEEPQQDAIEAVQQRPDPAKLLKAILNSKIVFYGQVLDRNDEPVAGAVIRYSALDEAGFGKVWNEGVPKKTIFADQDGRFEIQGKGGSLNVFVSREGYYKTKESGGGFTYGMPSGREPARDPENPAILRLHKKGQAEPLYFFDRLTPNIIRISVPKGKEIYYDLTTGKRTVSPTSTSIEILRDYWRPIRLPGQPKPEKYNWSFRVRVPGGGLRERNGKFEFMAPEDGYREELTITFDIDDPNWMSSGNLSEDLFIRFSDGTYGRVWLGTLSATSIRYNSHYNPTGSRNLEYDPNERIKVQFR